MSLMGVALPDQSMLKLGVPQTTLSCRTNMTDKGSVAAAERCLQGYKGIKGTGYGKAEGERTAQLNEVGDGKGACEHEQGRSRRC